MISGTKFVFLFVLLGNRSIELVVFLFGVRFMIGVKIRLDFVKYNMCLEGVGEWMIIQ